MKNPMNNLTRRAALALATAAALAASFATQAQEWPTKPVRIITPFPAGAGPEAVVRVLAEKLQKKWGQPVVVENKPGAGGILGNQLVASLAKRPQ
jgi:tripartite-type tricarboxylate transporter receptor subunit TctC